MFCTAKGSLHFSKCNTKHVTYIPVYVLLAGHLSHIQTIATEASLVAYFVKQQTY